VRGGQGGEDDLGGDIAALRVYTNIGVCFMECAAANPAAPIDIPTCRQRCPDFPPQADLDDLVSFLRSVPSPRYLELKDFNFFSFINGANVFNRNCATCHSNKGPQAFVLSNDQVNPLVADPLNATNNCRSKSTNWEDGHVWAQFSSQVYKDRVAAGNRGYRTMPLAGIWATAPFLHNQSIGPWADPTAKPSQRAKAYETAMWELLSANRTPMVARSPIAVGPFPAGTPLTNIFSRDPASGALLCDDVVENHGHYYGSDLKDHDKRDLILWLKYQ
jgi:mono/diheme cytochrome c family protein